MPDKKESKWLDKHPTLSDDDHQGLEAAAAVHEFQNHLSRPEAEAKAHADYVKEKAYESAAHHYVGMRAAVAANSETAAKQHGLAYAKAMDKAGHSPHEAPPQKVLDLAKKANTYNFKGHAADSLFEDPKVEIPKPGLLDRLKAMKAKLATEPETKQ